MKKYLQFLFCETFTVAGAAKFCNWPLARDTDLTTFARELAIVSPLCVADTGTGSKTGLVYLEWNPFSVLLPLRSTVVSCCISKPSLLLSQHHNCEHIQKDEHFHINIPQICSHIILYQNKAHVVFPYRKWARPKAVMTSWNADRWLVTFRPLLARRP